MVAQLVEFSPMNLLACASVGSNPHHCHFVSLGKTLNSQCLPWAEKFHQYIIAIYVYGFYQYTTTAIYGMVPDLLFSVGFLWAFRFPPTAIGKWLKDYEIGYGKDQAPNTFTRKSPSRDGD